MALLIDAADEFFGFLLRPWVDVAQQPVQREGAITDQVRWIFSGLQCLRQNRPDGFLKASDRRSSPKRHLVGG